MSVSIHQLQMSSNNEYLYNSAVRYPTAHFNDAQKEESANNNSEVLEPGITLNIL